MYLRPSSSFDLSSLMAEYPIEKSIIAIGIRYIMLNHCNKNGIKLKRITRRKINALTRNAFSFPCLIAIEFESIRRSPLTSIESAAISSPKSMRAAITAKNNTILLNGNPTERPAKNKCHSNGKAYHKIAS